jgi:hypothetical protein
MIKEGEKTEAGTPVEQDDDSGHRHGHAVNATRYFVINPGIDLPDPSDYDDDDDEVDNDDGLFPGERGSNGEEVAQSTSPATSVVVIGWAGRAESQKSPGLVVRLAAALKATHEHRADSKTCVLVAGGGTLVGEHHTQEGGRESSGNGSASAGGDNNGGSSYGGGVSALRGRYSLKNTLSSNNIY